ncbi:MAG: hypothetical protein U7127_18895 [Phormidium sp.]
MFHAVFRTSSDWFTQEDEAKVNFLETKLNQTTVDNSFLLWESEDTLLYLPTSRTQLIFRIS